MRLKVNDDLSSIVIVKENKAEAAQKALASYEDFPGARAIGMPFKEAVEAFIREKYGDRLGRDLTLDIIRDEKPMLRAAISAYKVRFGMQPCGLQYLIEVDPMQFARNHEQAVIARRRMLQTPQLDDTAFEAMRKHAQSKAAAARPKAGSQKQLSKGINHLKK